FKPATRTLCILRCLASADIIASSLQNPFCTRMPPSLPPHCFWCPSAPWSWCSSMTPSSVSSSPRRLRGGIVFPSLPLDSREVFVSRADALLDQRHDQAPALFSEADRHQPELLGRIGRHRPERTLLDFSAVIVDDALPLLRQRAYQHLLAEKPLLDEDVAQLATALLLLGQGG